MNRFGPFGMRKSAVWAVLRFWTLFSPKPFITYLSYCSNQTSMTVIFKVYFIVKTQYQYKTLSGFFKSNVWKHFGPHQKRMVWTKAAMSTDFSPRVPEIQYPTRTRVPEFTMHRQHGHRRGILWLLKTMVFVKSQPKFSKRAQINGFVLYQL